MAPDLHATAVAQGRTLFGQAGLTGVTGISATSLGDDLVPGSYSESAVVALLTAISEEARARGARS